MGWEVLKWHQLDHHQLMRANKGLILIHTVKLKPIIKAQISGNWSGIVKWLSEIIVTKWIKVQIFA